MSTQKKPRAEVTASNAGCSTSDFGISLVDNYSNLNSYSRNQKTIVSQIGDIVMFSAFMVGCAALWMGAFYIMAVLAAGPV